MPTPGYVYRARPVRAVDGDTAALVLDLGCHVALSATVRLLGVDTPELVGPTRAAGLAAREFAAGWLAAAAGDVGAWPLVVRTELDRAEKYGRLLGTVWRAATGACLNTELLAAGLAVPYDGGGR